MRLENGTYRGKLLRCLDCRSDFLRRILQTSRYGKVQSGVREYFTSLFCVCSFKADDHRHAHVNVLRRFNHAIRNAVAANNTTEDVDEDRFHILIGKNNLKPV